MGCVHMQGTECSLKNRTGCDDGCSEYVEAMSVQDACDAVNEELMRRYDDSGK
jgi:hypothetical protein